MIRQRSKPFRILLVAVAVGSCLYLGFRLFVSWQLGREVARWQAEGAPVVFADLQAGTVEADPDNGATEFRQAIATMTTGDFTGSSTAFLHALASDPVAGPADPEALADVRQYLTDRSEAVALITAASAKSTIAFDMNWPAVMAGMSDRNHVLGLMHWTRVWRGKIYLALAEERVDDAVQALETALGFADALNSEPRLEAYLARAVMLRGLAASAAHVANRAPLTPATSRRIGAAFHQRLAETNLSFALHGERCLGSARYLVPMGRGQALRDSPERLNPLMTLPGFGDRMDLELIRFYRLMRAYGEAADAFGSNRLDSVHARHAGNFHLPSLTVLHREQAELVAAVELARYGLLLNAAIADGLAPNSLEDLLANYEASRIDPCGDGSQPYGFLVNPLEYRIYSIGRNRIDEAGTEQYHIDGLREYRGGDIAFVRRLSP